MLESIKEYWYMWLILVALIVVLVIVMKKAAEFYLDIICDRRDGYLGISPATSPSKNF